MASANLMSENVCIGGRRNTENGVILVLLFVFYYIFYITCFCDDTRFNFVIFQERNYF